ncbi:DMT family transporter [Candidatus Micrarchaeota archaeon]|nr:DMT family transporter [Candidatus Micrarchaeota archaeon]
MDQKNLGVLAIIGASLMWALEPIFAKLAYLNSDFLQTSAVKAIVVSIVAALYLILRNRANFHLPKVQIPKIVYIALVGTILADLLYYFALAKIPVLNAVLIGHMQPIFIILIGYFILKEDKLTKFDYLGILIMILAGLFVSTKSIENLLALNLGTTEDLLVLIATIAWSTTAIVARKYLKKLNAGIITFYRFSIASVLFITYISLTSTFQISNLYQIALGIIVAVGTILYYEGIKRIKAVQASALELTSPFFAGVLGFLILNESVTLLQSFGILLMFVGVHFLSKKESKS